uniref:Uncharacterized protein n=1 Tax=Aegilops tauschii subsp. strangulata TaxID=200361 RepID=A0A453RYT3_AEGTS
KIITRDNSCKTLLGLNNSGNLTVQRHKKYYYKPLKTNWLQKHTVEKLK